nr:unnamed protein product [Spirometra erinaceieuropaei]
MADSDQAKIKFHKNVHALLATVSKADNNQLTQRLENLPAPDESASAGTRWCQLQNSIQLTVLDVLRGARRQHQDWLDDNAAAISQLLNGKHRPHRAYPDCPTDANKTASRQFRRLAQQLLQEMTDDHLLKGWSLQASTRLSATIAHDLLLADDCALKTVTDDDM